VTANTIHLREWLARRRGVALADYDALWGWSVRNVPDFWQAIWDYFEIESPSRCESILSGPVMPGTHWFAGTQVNYAAQVLRHVDAGRRADVPAIVFRNERLQREGRSLEIDWPELERQTAAVAGALSALGVLKGDRVAAYLPNTPEAVVAFLACASIGAIWSMCAPDMGVATVCDRFKQITPKVLIACDGTVYGGKVLRRDAQVAELLASLPSAETLIRVPCLKDATGESIDMKIDAGRWTGTVVPWRECVASRVPRAPDAVPFENPLWIVYSSGTTGLPKPIVHGHGGVMLEMLKLHRFHLDLNPSAQSRDRLHWYSSTGWVMWNLQVSALLNGTTICLYDGSPAYPGLEVLWRYAADVNATFLGAGAAYYLNCLKSGLEPKSFAPVSQLKALGSTGSPLPAEGYRWGDKSVRDGIWWCVISGGTDLASAFLGGTPELPTIPGEMQRRCLGADVQAWNEKGEPVVDDVGELVCVQPMPSMPLRFWGDEDGSRYQQSYFDLFPGVWRHGDWLKITPAGGAIVYGRSDATLNRHGHRLGTSEIYSAVEADEDVLDSLVVDLEFLGRKSCMPLFVVLRDGAQLDEALATRLRERIRSGVSPRFVPDEIHAVPEIPRTLTGKKQELPVKKLLLGRKIEDVVNKDACANPGAFTWFEEYARRRS